MNSPLGFLALHLHAHLPFVRHPEHPDFLEEDWFFEAVIETYLPLLDLMERLQAEGVPFQWSMTLSPTLCEMMADSLLRGRLAARLALWVELAEREEERLRHEPKFLSIVGLYRSRLRAFRDRFEKREGDLLKSFRALQDSRNLEIVTCAATHGILPLMDLPGSRRAQVRVAARNYRKHFGRHPAGIWLPECAFSPSVEDALRDSGLHYTFLDAHGLLLADPVPVGGIYFPLRSPKGVSYFGRDLETSRQVWSAREGYPGDPVYREFYRDIGYDAPYDYIRPYLGGDGLRKPTGMKYHRVTGNVGLSEKDPYDPEAAHRRAIQHAGHFHFNRCQQVRYLAGMLGTAPLLCAPYDAELFGHWWFEGPWFLEEVLRLSARPDSEVKLISPGAYLRIAGLESEEGVPSSSSWGHKGYFEMWLNGANEGLYRHLHRAERRMVELASRHPKAEGLQLRGLNQMARELLLAQSSDWAFIMTTGQAVPYATKRIRDHLYRFNQLAGAADRGTWVEVPLSEWEAKDGLFPELDYRVYL